MTYTLISIILICAIAYYISCSNNKITNRIAYYEDLQRYSLPNNTPYWNRRK